jgi:hypothetical protein
MIDSSPTPVFTIEPPRRGRRVGGQAGALMRRLAWAGCVAVLLAWATAPSARAGAVAPLVLDSNGVSAAAYGGWAAWSRADVTSGRDALVIRSPQGAISLPPIAESATPFDVELGPAGSGVAAVYSRCSNAAATKGCRIEELELGATGATEHTLTPPGGGSVHEPAIWRGRLVFLRHNPSGGHRRPDNLFAWSIGSRKPQQLTLPVSRGNRAARWPSGLTGLITGLTLNGRQVAYATSNAVGSFGETTLWFEPLTGHPELIDQETSGAGNVCEPAFISPALSGGWLYAYLHACDPSANPDLDRLTRYRSGNVESARFRFIRSGDESISSVVPDGGGVDWDAGGMQRLITVTWRRIPTPVAQTFCSRADPFC